jgi:pyruvate kinase
VALSFVRAPATRPWRGGAMGECPVPVIAKIERPEAVALLEQ